MNITDSPDLTMDMVSPTFPEADSRPLVAQIDGSPLSQLDGSPLSQLDGSPVSELHPSPIPRPIYEFPAWRDSHRNDYVCYGITLISGFQYSFDTLLRSWFLVFWFVSSPPPQTLLYFCVLFTSLKIFKSAQSIAKILSSMCLSHSFLFLFFSKHEFQQFYTYTHEQL